jgi:hypothetical protein
VDEGDVSTQPRIAVVEALWLSTPEFRVAETPEEEAEFGPFGMVGDRHASEFRMSRRAGRIPNDRQWSAVSTEEVEEICRQLGVAPFPFGGMGENIRLRGIALADVAEGAVLEFAGGVRLQVSGQNDPCENAAEELALNFGPVVRRLFVKAAYGRRGVVGFVLTPGRVSVGEEVRVAP